MGGRLGLQRLVAFRSGLTVWFLTAALGCSHSDETNPASGFRIAELRVTGIKVTTYDDPYGEQGCVWGTPSHGPDPDFAPMIFENPCLYTCFASGCNALSGWVSLPDRSPARIWIVRALDPEMKLSPL